MREHIRHVRSNPPHVRLGTPLPRADFLLPIPRVTTAQGQIACTTESATTRTPPSIVDGSVRDQWKLSDYAGCSVRGKLQRNRERMTVRGLNDNHNRDLKNLFKSAAISASTRPGPLRDFYIARVEKGMRPTMARLTLARKMAAISLTIWKKGVEFDAQQLQRQTA